MRKTHLLLAFVLFAGNFLFAQTWDILDKSMAAYNQNEGASTNQAWAVAQGGSAGSSVAQQTGYVNFTKTNAGSTARWAWLRPATALANVTSGTPYSIEVKVRVNPIGIADNASNYEANQISLRLGSKNTAARFYLRYGDGVTGGSVSSVSGANDAIRVNTSVWQVYRMVFHADHTKYDIYLAGEENPLFVNVPVTTTGDQNGIYFGAESPHRCNMDIEYVKMGTGDFFSTPRISSLTLSQDNHAGGNEATVTVTAATSLINNGSTILFSLVDGNNNVIVAPVEAMVSNNVATTNLVIPSNIAVGQYAVKAAVSGQIEGKEVTPKTAFYEIIDPVLAQTWDVLNRDFSVREWNASPAWSMEKGGGVPVSFVTQQTGYVNINKTAAFGSGVYGFLVSPNVTVSANTAYTCEIKARAKAIDKNEFPDTMKPTSTEAGGYEANQLGFILNNKHMSVYLIYGDDNTGYVASPVVDGTGVSPGITGRYIMNTAEWHVYKLIYNADNTKFDIYVDGELIFENIPLFNKTASNMAKIGGESWQRCNMDVEYVRMGTGDLVWGSRPKIISAGLSSDSHVANNARTIQVTAKTAFFNDGEKLLVSLRSENNAELTAPVEMTVNDNLGTVSLTIPATVPLGKYVVKLAAPDDKIGGETVVPKDMQYVVTDLSPLDTKILPQVKPIGFVKEIDDYIYAGPSKEFIFPSILDTKKYTVDGIFRNGQSPIDRYYLFYAPHENPGGIFLSTAPTLDGPWTEYSGSTGMTPGTVMDFAWASTQSDIIKNGAERHISGCQIVWNDVQNKYIMYFHGPNSTTHYATSENLVDWTFGASILVSHQFSPIGAEASYAKTFEHEIPGLGNKYVMLLMNQENQIRRIYWAHSVDGINWTPVPKALISPDLDYKKVPGTDRKPSYDGGGTGAYGNNISGPFLMEKNGRYFVFCHGNADNLMVVEVGESFDMEIHWGEYLKSTEVLFNRDGVPTPTRPAAPDFILDDEGKWYMFFEAGGRLGANIGYAKEEVVNSFFFPESEGVLTYPSTIGRGEKFTVKAENADKLSVEIIDLSGNRMSHSNINASSGKVYAPVVPGFYFVKITTSEHLVKTSKIIVK
jgi:hypothetical protein